MERRGAGAQFGSISVFSPLGWWQQEGDTSTDTHLLRRHEGSTQSRRRRKIVVHQWRTCCYDSVSMKASSYEQTCCLKTSMYVSQWSDLLGMVCCVQTPCIYTNAWIDVFVVFLSKLDNYESDSQFHAVLLYQTHADECAADSQGLSTWKFQHSGWSRFNVIINILKSK